MSIANIENLWLQPGIPTPCWVPPRRFPALFDCVGVTDEIEEVLASPRLERAEIAYMASRGAREEAVRRHTRAAFVAKARGVPPPELPPDAEAAELAAAREELAEPEHAKRMELAQAEATRLFLEALQAGLLLDLEGAAVFPERRGLDGQPGLPGVSTIDREIDDAGLQRAIKEIRTRTLAPSRAWLLR